MIKLLAIIVALVGLCTFNVNGQITLLNNSIRPGDQIIKQRVSYIKPGEAGKDILWDFSKLKTKGKYVLEYFEPEIMNDSILGEIYVMGKDTFPAQDIQKNELIIGIENHTVYYYRIIDNWLTLLGFENPVSQMNFHNPLRIMPYPLDYKMNVSNQYAGNDLYSFESSMNTTGDIQVEADAMGCMLIPSGDTLKNVMRVKSVQELQGTSNSIRYKTTAHLVKEAYAWYVKGYRYPVFETLRILDNSKEIFKTAFFYSPEDHSYLENDMPNLALLDEMNHERSDSPKEIDFPSKWAMNGSSWNCSFAPNPVSNTLYIKYEITKDAPVAMQLYSISGAMVKSIPHAQMKAGMYNESFDVSSLPAGSYILRANVGTEAGSKIVIKK